MSSYQFRFSLKQLPDRGDIIVDDSFEKEHSNTLLRPLGSRRHGQSSHQLIQGTQTRQSWFHKHDIDSNKVN
jgi:hypothetical protein